ncbi:hypothetical protein C8J57DRAFT_1212556 [Mycena rebaudengoi]|nr:hypothetical protein C8J57DRAFT_1212556 [Mycena rebaudengoi]
MRSPPRVLVPLGGRTPQQILLRGAPREDDGVDWDGEIGREDAEWDEEDNGEKFDCVLTAGLVGTRVASSDSGPHDTVRPTRSCIIRSLRNIPEDLTVLNGSYYCVFLPVLFHISPRSPKYPGFMEECQMHLSGTHPAARAREI